MSGLLRFQLDECQKDNIAIEDEVGFLTNYIDFESLRKRQEAKISFQHVVTSGARIPPLLFLPFVENAFKHLSRNRDRDKNIIEISLLHGNSEVRFLCRNTISATIGTPSVASGIGIRNVQKRLKLLYPDTYRLDIHRDGVWHSVNLILPC